MPKLSGIEADVWVEPLEQWPTGYERTPEEDRRGGPFQRKGIVARTIRELGHELRQLDVDEAVLQVEVPEGEIRQRDGLPYKRADVDPGVVLTFEAEGGTQTYPCDTFDGWQENLRAITLALRSLRRVSRYGVGHGSEQYRGFTALPADVDEAMDPEAAARVLVSTAGWRSAEDHDRRVASCLESEEQATSYLRTARKRSHPDAETGNAESFKRVQTAGDVLRQHHARSEVRAG